MIHGFPISASLPEDLGFGERFWYWRGVSGQSYIHSIYSRESCPPVAGAVFVAIQKVDATRRAISVGRIPVWGENAPRSGCGDFFRNIAADEIHVHLLAQDNECAERVMRDLLLALEPELVAPPKPHEGGKPVQLLLLAA
ncbi:hypothetical protein [Aestuariivirga sp.]|uniref:hypothetical protein n=1 Tax=Aestuariivirga sp. TaxID=2650926 RepID=UPI003594497E